MRCGKNVCLGGGSSTLAALYLGEVDEVIRLFPTRMVLPHLQVELLQVCGVLLGVEQRAADSLLPHTRPDHLQAEGDTGTMELNTNAC